MWILLLVQASLAGLVEEEADVNNTFLSFYVDADGNTYQTATDLDKLLSELGELQTEMSEGDTVHLLGEPYDLAAVEDKIASLAATQETLEADGTVLVLDEAHNPSFISENAYVSMTSFL